jgi:putative transcriptional regulator
MSKKAFDAIMAGIEDAVAYAKGDKRRSKAHVIKVPQVNVRAARRRLGMSQDRFAQSFGVSAATIRNWEQGRRRPEGPARVLLAVIDREPEAVKRALGVRPGRVR